MERMKREAKHPEALCGEAGPSPPAAETRARSSPFRKGFGRVRQSVSVVRERARGLAQAEAQAQPDTDPHLLAHGRKWAAGPALLGLGQVGGQCDLTVPIGNTRWPRRGWAGAKEARRRKGRRSVEGTSPRCATVASPTQRGHTLHPEPALRSSRQETGYGRWQPGHPGVGGAGQHRPATSCLDKVDVDGRTGCPRTGKCHTSPLRG